jgi:hypothetical protein
VPCAGQLCEVIIRASEAGRETDRRTQQIPGGEQAAPWCRRERHAGVQEPTRRASKNISCASASRDEPSIVA